MKLKRGDLVEVRWLDIYEDVTGDPEQADVAPRVSIGYFWSMKDGAHELPVFITTTTMDIEASNQNGWCAYPLPCVVDVKIIRRGRGKGYRAAPEWNFDPNDDSQCDLEPRTGDSSQHSRKAKVRGAGSGSINVQEDNETCTPEA